MGNVWTGPSGDSMGVEGDIAGNEVPSDLQDPMEVPKRVFEDIKDNLVGYVLSGLVMSVVVFGVIMAVMAVAFGLMLPGIIMEDDTITMVGSFLGMAVYLLGILGFTAIAYPMMGASMMRAIDQQRIGVSHLGGMSSLNSLQQDAPRIVGFYIIGTILIFVGALFCYLPGLVASAVVLFAMPMVVFERVPAVSALQYAWKHMMEHPVWHAAVWLLAIMASAMLSMTIVGMVLAYPVLFAFQVFAYRAAYGDQGVLATVAEP